MLFPIFEPCPLSRYRAGKIHRAPCHHYDDNRKWSAYGFGEGFEHRRRKSVSYSRSCSRNQFFCQGVPFVVFGDTASRLLATVMYGPAAPREGSASPSCGGLLLHFLVLFLGGNLFHARGIGEKCVPLMPPPLPAARSLVPAAMLGRRTKSQPMREVVCDRNRVAAHNVHFVALLALPDSNSAPPSDFSPPALACSSIITYTPDRFEK